VFSFRDWGGLFKARATNEVNVGRDPATPASRGGAGLECVLYRDCVLYRECVLYGVGRGRKESREEEEGGWERRSIFTMLICVSSFFLPPFFLQYIYYVGFRV
jgi:hypothetical protein